MNGGGAIVRQIVIKTKTKIEFRNLGSNGRSLTAIGGRVYRTDEALMSPDLNSNREIVIYDLDGTQPYGNGDYLDPDVTMALIDIARSGNGKGVNRLGWLNSLDMKKVTPIIAVIVVVYALISGGI